MSLHAISNFLQIDTERMKVVYEETATGSEPGSRFYIMVAVSTLISGFGLIADSTAVVIGAMLVAPLMTPIFGISLALVRGDTQLFRNSVQAEIVGVLAAIAMGYLLGLVIMLINPIQEATPEMLARTKPNLFDLFVAVLAGFAGTYALIDEKISPALPGVAIATAIVPPLANSGLCIAYGAYRGALGSFLLFFANFLSILIVASILFSMAGMGREFGTLKQKHIVRRFGWAAACFLIVATLLGMALFNMVQKSRLRDTVKRVLASEFAEYPATGINGILLDKRGDKLFVLAELHSPSQITPDQVSVIEDELAARTQTPTELIVRTFKSTDITSSGSNSTVTAQSLDGFFVSPIGNPKIQKIRLSEQTIREFLDNHIGLDLLDVDYLESDRESAILAMISGIRRLTRSETQQLELLIRQRTDDPMLSLIVRFIPVELFDKDGPIRYGWSTVIKPTEKQKEVAEALRKEIRGAFPENGPHSLEKINTTITDGGYFFLVEISGLREYNQANRHRLKENLMALSDKPITLHVWMNQGTVLTEDGLVSYEDLMESHFKALGDPYKQRIRELLKSAR